MDGMGRPFGGWKIDKHGVIEAAIRTRQETETSGSFTGKEREDAAREEKRFGKENK
ncbi:hypothetical protein JW899_04130 [Candidatus Uhrbacteria bacterium]|nr:hypothetical protein [Candidatus Uhrbacteria bacterium]